MIELLRGNKPWERSVLHRLRLFPIMGQRSIVSKQMCRTTSYRDPSNIVLCPGGRMAQQKSA
eukprot:11691680-Prorocentrum_lima.AAC.1